MKGEITPQPGRYTVGWPPAQDFMDSFLLEEMYRIEDKQFYHVLLFSFSRSPKFTVLGRYLNASEES